MKGYLQNTTPEGEMSVQKKVIFLMAESFPYELFWNDPKPEVNWDTGNGQWVGYWKYGWYDQIGDELAKLTDEFTFEVWQPDLRADKIYTYSYNNRLCHKLFPAQETTAVYGFRTIRHVRSRSICERFRAEQATHRLLLHLDGIGEGVVRDALHISFHTSIPIIMQFLGNVQLPLDRAFKIRRNLPALFNDVRDHNTVKRLFANVDAAMCCNKRSKISLARHFKKQISVLPVGVDFDFWKPKLKKKTARKKLGLENDKFIILSSCRFNPSKQVDKMINRMNELDKYFDFQYIVTGHGDEAYQKYLANLGSGLSKRGKMVFTGYLTDEQLLEYYAAADLFASTSLTEGAPVAAIKALAMDLPIFTTDTGLVAELLTKYGKGVVVPIDAYNVWLTELEAIFEGRKVAVLGRDLARSLLHWPNLASKYLEIYISLYDKYYG
jgi:glycosyltransferase involved in cell wall biosynthesis